MSNQNTWNKDVSSLLKNIYRCADKSNWYSSVAAAYERTRPRYPEAIWSKMQTLVKLQPGKSVLEIGSGPGIASVELAKLGVDLVCLEPSEAAGEIVRRKCGSDANVEVINTTFEAWELPQQKFDLVVATTSFHWLAPEIRNQKAAAVLKERGKLVLMWNTPPQPCYEVHQSVVQVYQDLAPELSQYQDCQSHEHNLALIGQDVINSGYFNNLITAKVITHVTYPLEDYLTLLSTLSPYIALESTQRSQLLAELQRVLMHHYGDSLDLHYLSLLQIADKREFVV